MQEMEKGIKETLASFSLSHVKFKNGLHSDLVKREIRWCNGLLAALVAAFTARDYQQEVRQQTDRKGLAALVKSVQEAVLPKHGLAAEDYEWRTIQWKLWFYGLLDDSNVRLANEVMLASQVRSLDRQPVLDMRPAAMEEGGLRGTGVLLCEQCYSIFTRWADIAQARIARLNSSFPGAACIQTSWPSMAFRSLCCSLLLSVMLKSASSAKCVYPGGECYELMMQKCEGSANWTIHGLWAEWDNECPGSAFNISALSPLRSELDAKWSSCPEFSMKNEDFWKHEWEKHGTCSQMDEVSFFNKTLQLYAKYKKKCSKKTGKDCTVCFNRNLTALETCPGPSQDRFVV
ncbi:ddiA [Symbiodinium microadriaticum]|nr:ddiA [Symbiodinium microadriaticum]